MPGLSPDRQKLLASLLRDKGLAPGARIPGRGTQSAPLSYDQYRLWLLEQAEPGTSLYNDCVVLTLEGGALDADVLERSVRAVVARHEILRTTFVETSEGPIQTVQPSGGVTLRREDLRELDAGERPARMAGIIAEEVRAPFRLDRLPLMRASLLHLEDGVYAFAVTMHHIISDGASYGILYRELSRLYPTLAQGRPYPLPDLPVQFGDFAAWERDTLRDERLEAALEYWKAKLAPPLPVLALAEARAVARPTAHRGALYRFALPGTLFQPLQEFCRGEEVTPYAALLAGYAALLSCLGGQEDILVGTPSSGRNRVELEGLVGFFIRTLVIRSDLSGNPCFRELVRRTRTTVLEAFAHQELPFERLAAAVQGPRPGKAPLIQALFCHMKGLLPPLELPGFRSSCEVADTGHSRFDLSLMLDESEDGISGWIEFDTDLFAEEAMAGLVRDYGLLLRQALRFPDTSLRALRDLLMDDERQRAESERQARRESRGQDLMKSRRRSVAPGGGGGAR